MSRNTDNDTDILNTAMVYPCDGAGPDADLGVWAVLYATYHWQVFPLRGKVPAIAGGRGVLDATADLDTITAWWSGKYCNSNIGGRVPESMIVIDVDPQHDGHLRLAELEAVHGPLPATLTDVSGRGPDSRHLFFRRPPGRLSAGRLGRGIDLKTSAGYVVLPPSIHPDTHRPYTRIERPVAAPPSWLIALLRNDIDPSTRVRQAPPKFWAGAGSVADRFTAGTSWADVLTPHGWRCDSNDPDADGAVWLHPAATSSCSATVRDGCLFVYSTNTVFEVTEPGNPHGYTRFRAYAVLNHRGDMSAAAKQIVKGAAL
jgi:hypothetical protein